MISRENIKVGLVFDYPIYKIDSNERGLIRNFVPKEKTATAKFLIHNISETRENPLYADCYCLNAPKDRTVMISMEKIEEYGTFAYFSECERIKGGTVEQVSHPSHYAWLKDLCGVEPLDICRHMDFNIGNAIKYLLRKDKVDGSKTKTEKRIEDLRKAVFYINDEINNIVMEKEKGEK